MQATERTALYNIRRHLNRKKPHLVQREKGWWMCNFPGGARWYMIGDGLTPEAAYDTWYQFNLDRLSGHYHSREAFNRLRAAGLKTVHPKLGNQNGLRNYDLAPNGTFPTSHAARP